jgi:hypothetical protein
METCCLSEALYEGPDTLWALRFTGAESMQRTLYGIVVLRELWISFVMTGFSVY